MSASGKPRPPWWIYLVVACVVTTYCVNLWNDVMGPDGVGWSRGYTLQATEVFPGGPFDKAGIRKGDVLLEASGQRLDGVLDWDLIRMTFEIGKPFTVDVQRGPQLLHFTVVIERRNSQNWGARDYLLAFAIRGAQLVLLLLAILIVFKRPGDLGARLAAWLFSCMAAVTIPSYGLTATLHYLPAPIAVAALAGWILPFSSAAAWFCFFASVPRRLLTRTWHWLLALLPTAVCMTWGAIWLAPNVYSHSRMTGIVSMRTLIAVGIVAATQELAGIGILIFNYFHLQEVNERRKVGVLLLGSALGWAGAMISTLALNYVQGLVGALLFLAFPISYSYAILRQRLFDVSVIVRRALQYALARRVIASILPAAIGLLLVDLVTGAIHLGEEFGSGHHPAPGEILSRVLSARGWLYAILAGLVIVAHRKRESWMAALDKRFFRERYNAQQILRDVVQEVRAARSLEEVAPRIVSRIEAALHPEFVALMVRAPNQPTFICHASLPADFALQGLAAESKLMAAFRLFAKPLQISLSESGWLKQQLPHSDTDFLRQSRIDLIVPVLLATGGREALLVLGPKKSEEPYATEDQELLMAIADSLALLLERPAGATASSGLEECPRCGTCYDSGMGKCAQDGSQLTPSTLPRLLTSRYRLDRRLGRGGMGTVYSALDTALERQVALKLIREDLVSSPEAAERFRREAKAAAAITHPNLVTLHDFAVDAGNRAFLVMELLPGITLRQQLQQGRLSCERMLEIVRGVCSALAVAHQRGLVHRDLKPENIILAHNDGRYVPKVLDFGVAKFVGSSDATMQATVDTGAGVLIGTPQYMSPEQLKGEPVSPHWDLWALAVITYEMLAPAHPFGSAASVAALHNAILSGQFTPITVYLPEAPLRWQEFFDRTLSLKEARRPASASEFLSDCERTFAIEDAQAAN